MPVSKKYKGKMLEHQNIVKIKSSVNFSNLVLNDYFTCRMFYYVVDSGFLTSLLALTSLTKVKNVSFFVWPKKRKSCVFYVYEVVPPVHSDPFAENSLSNYANELKWSIYPLDVGLIIPWSGSILSWFLISNTCFHPQRHTLMITWPGLCKTTILFSFYMYVTATELTGCH